MQVRIYRDGRWHHIMLDEEAWDNLGKFVSDVFEAMFQTPGLISVPVRAVPRAVLPDPKEAVEKARKEFLEKVEKVGKVEKAKGR